MHKSYAAFLGDLCEIFCWDKYGVDAHEIDVCSLDSLNDAENVDIAAETTKAKVNPLSKTFINHFMQFKSANAIKLEKTSRGLDVSLSEEVESQKEFYLSFPGFQRLFTQVRNFVNGTIARQFDPKYGVNYVMETANAESKRMITLGDTVYLVEKKSVVLNTIKKIFFELVGLGAFIDDEALDSLIRKISDKITKMHNPYSYESFERFLQRAIRDKLHPIRVCGRCTDVRKEENTVVLYLEGDGAIRVYTYEDCFKIMNYKELDETVLTIDGIPYKNHGIPVVVALRIIRRRAPDPNTVIG
ncbi:MAG: hypothetical protein ABSC91_09650 [Candidatus Bathyarchaeia archaeon]|jgi:hypothetical protein